MSAEQSPKTDGTSGHSGTINHRREWPLQLPEVVKSPPLFLRAALGNLLVVVSSVFSISVIALLVWYGPVALYVLWVELNSDNPVRALEATKIVLSTLAAAIGVIFVTWRLIMLGEQNRIAEGKRQIDRETQFTSIFSKSVDQLGATREHKEARDSDDGSEAITRTVPNIEVRLGGIHALARLAGDSPTDSSKVGKLLVSYIRENSWYDREGRRFSKPELIASHDIGKYRSVYGREDVSEEQTSDFLKWCRDKIDAFNALWNWHSSITNYRVDVSEATASIFMINVAESISYHEIEDSLFNKSSIDISRTTHKNFNKCAFSDCTIRVDIEEVASFSNCLFIDCKFFVSGTINSNYCTNVRSYFFLGNEATVSFNESFNISIYIDPEFESTVTGTSSVFLKSAFHHGTKETLKILSSHFIDTNFTRIVLSENSHFLHCTFPYSRFVTCDLSQSQWSANAALVHARGDSSTKLPPGTVRPTTWHDQDGNPLDEIAGHGLPL
jgi:hypothetical protein